MDRLSIAAPGLLFGWRIVDAALGHGIEAGSHLAPKVGGSISEVAVRWIRNPCGDVTTPALSAEGISLLMAFDWGRPGYCRQQLLALGFAPEDLAA